MPYITIMGESAPNDTSGGFRARHQLYRSVSAANVTEEQRDDGQGTIFEELEDFRHKAEFVFETIRGWDLPIVFVLSVIVTVTVGNKNLPFLGQSTAAVGTLGALYSFALVFRTNICYSRWVSPLRPYCSVWIHLLNSYLLSPLDSGRYVDLDRSAAILQCYHWF